MIEYNYIKITFLDGNTREIAYSIRGQKISSEESNVISSQQKRKKRGK